MKKTDIVKYLQNFHSIRPTSYSNSLLALSLPQSFQLEVEDEFFVK